MAWRPEHLVVEGELDNTESGWTTGWIQLEGAAERIELKLAGNCHPDLAGWKFRIIRTDPPLAEDRDEEGSDYSDLNPDQSGCVGDITADQMIKHHDIPVRALLQRLHAGEKPPFTWRKCLYLEWYSNYNGRVVIQSTRLAVQRVGERSFELTEQQWAEQQRQNCQEMDFFLTQLGDSLENGALENGALENGALENGASDGDDD